MAAAPVLAAARWVAAVLFLQALQPASSFYEVEMYVGAGPFEEVQAILRAAEEEVFGRTKGQVTSIAGYAGGRQNSDVICTNNYDDLGHVEVVSVRLPHDRIADALQWAWEHLFPDGERQDTAVSGDKYRAAFGLPGGYNGNLELISRISAQQPGYGKRLSLQPGYGGEGDTLGQSVMYVYDSKEFPFHQAEVWNQFSSSSRRRPAADSEQQKALLQTQRLRDIDCPPQWIHYMVHPFLLGTISVCWASCLCVCGYYAIQRKVKDVQSKKQVRPADGREMFSVRIVNPPWQ